MEEQIKDYISTNSYQTKLTEELRNSLHKEVWNDLMEFIDSVKFISWLIQPESIRGYASDRPRNESGKIIVDITKPHILKDMDYFRERAIFFEKHGKYTHIRPNPNPKSEYAQFWKKEMYRWKYGMVRESDGEWIPGGFYFYLNYSPIWINTEASKGADGKKVRGIRKRHFPNVWLGDYLFFHYLEQARDAGAHAKILKTRGVGASYKLASMSPRNMYVEPGLPNFHLASDKGFLDGEKGVYGKVIDVLDWIKDSTPFSGLRLVNSPRSREIQLGYEEDGSRKGYKSSVYGISLKDNPDKARGVRGPLIHYEEDGLFPNLEKAWSVNRKAVEDGDIVYGLMCALGTGGVEGADFEGSEKLFRNPLAYNIHGIPNVFDKNSNGESLCGFFWGAYLNRARCYDDVNGEPDVIKSLIEVLNDRFTVKYNSSDPQVITQKMAEEPIVPSEAMMRTSGTIFPVADLKDYRDSVRIIGQRYFDAHYVGDLVLTNKGVEWKPSSDVNLNPIRRFPTGTDKPEGAIEIFEMPKTDHKGKVDPLRYIAGIDPIDDDYSGTTSLACIRILDLYTDRVVAEYTGRPKFANDFYETCRRMLMFYNAKANYENDKKGLFAYFDQKRSLHLLCDTPQILRDMDYVKGASYGNKAHPYSQLVKTPYGVKEWGKIKIGDVLYGTYGNKTTVIDIPFDEECDIYELKLRDGRTVKSSLNHLWKVVDWNNYEKVISTKDMLCGYYRLKGKYMEYKYYIPQNIGVEYEYVEPLIDPYLLGLTLGDGCFTQSRHHNINFTSTSEDMAFYMKYLNLEYKSNDDRHHSIRYKNCGKIFEKLNLHDKKGENKFIPKDYICNSRNIRLEVLRGLFDSDGYIGYGGNPEFTNTSKQLCLDIIEILRSLGISCNLMIAREKTDKTKKAWKVRVYSDVRLFNLERKYSRQKITKTRNKKTAIIDIKYVGKEQSKCVTVDSLDSCYLIGDFICTHNSKGTNSGKMVNAWGRRLQKDWLLSPATIQDFDAEGNQIGEKLNMHTERGIAYIEELIAWNQDINADRVSAMGMLMIYREDRLKYLSSKTTEEESDNEDKYIEENFKNAYNGQKSYEKWTEDLTFN